MNKIKLLGVLAFIGLGMAVWVQQRHIVSIKKERDRYQMNSNALLSEMKEWRIDSTTMATDVKTLRLTVDEMERYRAEDLVKIKQMGVKIKNLKAAAKHQLEVNADIKASVRDSIVIRDTVPVIVKSVSMITPYLQLSGIIEKDSLIGKIHLPVTLRQAVWIEYKRRWLFWKKVVAIHQTITSDNPHVEIKYSEYIIIQK
ncbi:DUF6549 family protein [Bacteroides graminisolvens]|jgi:hypothetical protein|uniref:Uncharacterized protein n=2 Tax=Bacteroides TaxID=816 RepID=A0A069D8S1_9BACE|nr:DUF6549 family protein [Bacteroides graminisolvens]GAK36584.1 hypothetical protein JCM15093_1756 [Bacteroides graminisolvens DSM 19988 = JCM 15093]DAX32040.1 MAG TPA: hypothetical protein [Caudoviricetes sp.]